MTEDEKTALLKWCDDMDATERPGEAEPDITRLIRELLTERNAKMLMPSMDAIIEDCGQ
jgi:hypothetical protein